VIFAATALPEEILFRSLIQNLLMLRFGFTNAILLAAAVVFGCSHLNNGAPAAPNWRYAIVATIAGFTFGKVFQKAGSVLSSAGCHAMVNAVKYFFF
jgi:membrane protease YdiL (CAAX protease family)